MNFEILAKSVLFYYNIVSALDLQNYFYRTFYKICQFSVLNVFQHILQSIVYIKKTFVNA